MQKQEVHGPRHASRRIGTLLRSVQQLVALNPVYGATGHGTPMSGKALAAGLAALVADFDEVAVPDHGRYVPEDE